MEGKIKDFSNITNIELRNNKSISLKTPVIMGILNLTPDSFYKRSRVSGSASLLNRVEEMIVNGASIIDVGAVSTRPGSDEVAQDIELRRLIQPIANICERFPEICISVDTYRSKVAYEAIHAGAHIINDISGGTIDKSMFDTIIKLDVPYILMHIHGNPQTMQTDPIDKDVVKIVRDFFIRQTAQLQKIKNGKLILDPGFGFGKSLQSNYQLLSNLSQIRVNDLPVLVGISRKSMINKVLDIKPEEALTGTISLNMLALINGANILRVHDVKEAAECVKLFNYYLKNK